MKLNAKEILITIILIIILVLSIVMLIIGDVVPVHIYFYLVICFIIVEARNLLLRHWLFEENKDKTEDDDKGENKNG